MSEPSNNDLMSVLLEIRQQTKDIGSLLDKHAASFTQHIADDALLARDVRQLAKRQRGFIGGLVAAVVMIGAGVFLAFRWLLGHD
jgi:hypothetical protein